MGVGPPIFIVIQGIKISITVLLSIFIDFQDLPRSIFRNGNSVNISVSFAIFGYYLVNLSP
jgi:hypothetical protein